MTDSRFARRARAGALVALVCALATAPAMALHEEPFGPIEPLDGPSLDLPSKAEGGVHVRRDRIRDRGALAIPLPDGGQVVFVRRGGKHRDGGDFVWTGKGRGHGGDAVITGRGGAIAGVLTTADGTYLIRETPGGQVRIVLIDDALLPAEIGRYVPGDAGGGGVLPGDGAPSAGDGNVVLDALIVYTPEARAAAGSAAAIEATIQNAVDWTNVAYGNSLMAVEQRLVHTQEVPFSEATQCRTCSNSGNACSSDAQCGTGTCAHDMGCDLTWLRQETNGSDYDGDGQTYMDDLRNTHGADLVSLITQSGQYCGIAYVMTSIGSGFASWAVSVTAQSCLPSTHAHETGHNLGCMHDPDNSDIPGARDYAFGHRYCMSGGFRTIMSYSCSGATRVPHFSNPDVFHDNGAGSLSTGQWAADCTPTCTGGTCPVAPCRDCAMTIVEAAPTAAAWRASAAPLCGDGVVNQAAEECDGGDLGGATCAGLGYDGGTLTCAADCTLDDSACAECGNGVVESGEACDGGNLGGATCGDAGCGGGVPACTADCSAVSFATCTGCPTCGDGVVNQPSEECDGGDLAGASCAEHGCQQGGVACTASCTVDYAACSLCCGDGTCESGETCQTCGADCVGGTAAQCGNGVCEAGDGEDCVSCPADCRGKQSGKPSDRFCCGDGDGQGALPCSDAVCNGGGFQCSAAASGSYCCGDGACAPAEESACPLDCGAPPTCGDGICNGSETLCTCGDCGTPPGAELSCSDGLDDDCDGLVDCADGDCADTSTCACLPKGDVCSSNAECCSGRCRSRRGVSTCN